jgi:hypothetical protein
MRSPCSCICPASIVFSQRLAKHVSEATNTHTREQEVMGRSSGQISFDTTYIARKTTRPTIILLLRVFVAAGTCLPSCCLARIGWVHIQTHRPMGGIYEVCR